MKQNLTKGNITKSLLLFAIPMILGDLLQQFYNIADTFIVGKYISSQALGAVGSAFTLMTFLTSIILGLCMGSGVLFSMLFGAEKIDEMKNAFFVSFIGIGIFSVVLEMVCMFFLDSILQFLRIPEEVYEDSGNYIFIIFIGIVFTFVYNYFTTLLRALGDSKTPLIFLAISSVMNIVLDYVLIVYVSKRVESAAFATLLSQMTSAIGVALFTILTKKELLPQKKHCHLNLMIFKKIKDYSLLTCIQQSVMNFGILMIQGLVNSFGVPVMSAFAAAVKIDAFAYMPVQDFGNAFSTFIAQNKGAGEEERIQKGLKQAIKISAIFCIVISIVIYVFAEQLMLIFIEAWENEIIYHGVQYLRIEGSCYIGIGCLFLLYGYYRGIGKPGMSIVLTVISLGTRVVLAYQLSPIWGTIAIWWAIPIGWFLADSTGLLICYAMKKQT